jgi:hypothetical protein
MADAKEVKPWLGRYKVISEDHHPDLDSRAAVHEFRGKLPREQAEQEAHKDYLQDHAYRSAAHHLLGIRAALAGGNEAAAEKHGSAYATAMKAAGHGALETPPEKVLNYLKDLKSKVYSFKNHEADGLFEPSVLPEASSGDEALKQKIEKLKGMKDQLK